MESEVPLCTYESAGGVVVTASGELVLVLVRTKRLGPDSQPEIRLPKGHIEAGESQRVNRIRRADLIGRDKKAAQAHKTLLRMPLPAIVQPDSRTIGIIGNFCVDNFHKKTGHPE